ncbi:tetratricopeptide repeat protein [Fibrobacterota bacterium]
MMIAREILTSCRAKPVTPGSIRRLTGLNSGLSVLWKDSGMRRNDSFKSDASIKSLLSVILLVTALPLLCQAQTADPDSAAPQILPVPQTPQGDILDELDTEGPVSGESWWKRTLRFLGLSPSIVKEGEKAYVKEDYDLALQKFLEARLDRPQSQELAMNIGNAQYKKKKYDQAIEGYKESLIGENTGVAASAYYNMGNAYFRKGEFAVQQGDQQGIQHYRSAMANYKKSLEINPDNPDAKRNIEVVQARIKELLEKQEQQQQQDGQQQQQPPPEPSEKAREVLARAMQLVKQRKYEEAKQLLEAIIQEDATAVSFQAHVQRIDDILNILAGRPPEPPAAQDPRSQQQGLGVI